MNDKNVSRLNYNIKALSKYKNHAWKCTKPTWNDTEPH